jgi:uncharacterized protein
MGEVTDADRFGTLVPACARPWHPNNDSVRIDKSGLEVVDDDECFALAKTARIGRVVYSDRALPVIVPVNFVLDGADVVMRTQRRSRLATHAAGNVVAFEVDDIDPTTKTGWSVVFTGTLELVDDAFEVRRLEGLGLHSWAPSAHDRYLRLRPELVSGRRIVSAQPDNAEQGVSRRVVPAS